MDKISRSVKAGIGLLMCDCTTAPRHITADARKPDGPAVKTFDQAFIGGEALDLDGLFSELGIKCPAPKSCTSDVSDTKQIQLRDAVFSAR
jgi:hypothetical protein